MRAMPAPEAASIVRVADFCPCDCIPIGFNRKRFVSDSLHFRSSRCEKTALKQLPLRGSALICQETESSSQTGSTRPTCVCSAVTAGDPSDVAVGHFDVSHIMKDTMHRTLAFLALCSAAAFADPTRVVYG